MERDDRIISEGIAYGLDIEAERCDADLLRQDVLRLRAMDEASQSVAVERLNRGESLGSSDVWLEVESPRDRPQQGEEEAGVRPPTYRISDPPPSTFEGR